MTNRAIFAAAAAIAAASAAAQEAEALTMTPMSADASIANDVVDARPHATMAPEDFARPADELYEPNAVIADARARLQCVPFAREESGVEIYGNANTWWAQAADKIARVDAPVEGGVLVLHGYGGANRGHVAVITEIVSDRMIVVDHANWLNRGEITRNVPVRDVSEAGDWSEVQVWHIPTQQWGARTYRVQGVIVPDQALAKARASAPVA